MLRSLWRLGFRTISPEPALPLGLWRSVRLAQFVWLLPMSSNRARGASDHTINEDGAIDLIRGVLGSRIAPEVSAPTRR
jgi:hypothetical protein